MSEAPHGKHGYRCACLLLAAGGSSRLGRPKQLLRLDGEMLVHRAGRLACEAGYAPICVVLGSAADEIRKELSDLPIASVYNEHWATGMSSSLRAGVSHFLQHKSQPSHLLVLVCDQVRIPGMFLQQLQDVSRKQEQRIVAAEYAGGPGVPAIFPAVLFSRLTTIEGDRGARKLLKELREQVVCLACPEASIDIDTPDDARRAGVVREE